MSAARRTANDWSAGDRSGKMSRATLRELRMRALVSNETDADVYMEVLELLENLIDVVVDVTGESHLVIDELPDQIRGIDEGAKSEVESKDEELLDAKKEADEQRERVVEMEKEHDDELRHRAEVSDEWKRRAEQAEHDLSEAVRNGHAIDRGASERERDLQLKVDELITQKRVVMNEGIHRINQLLDELRITKRLVGVQADKIAASAQAKLGSKPAEEVDMRRVLAESVAELAALNVGKDREIMMLVQSLTHARAANPVKKRGGRKAT